MWNNLEALFEFKKVRKGLQTIEVRIRLRTFLHKKENLSNFKESVLKATLVVTRKHKEISRYDLKSVNKND
ncbi:hypothetical protein ASG61_19035 [Bacillus sp. Leaf75]|nr:hypothetical protein ASG61_19035 [Bacillus sp. Leaf75]